MTIVSKRAVMSAVFIIGLVSTAAMAQPADTPAATDKSQMMDHGEMADGQMMEMMKDVKMRREMMAMMKSCNRMMDRMAEVSSSQQKAEPPHKKR